MDSEAWHILQESPNILVLYQNLIIQLNKLGGDYQVYWKGPHIHFFRCINFLSVTPTEGKIVLQIYTNNPGEEGLSLTSKSSKLHDILWGKPKSAIQQISENQIHHSNYNEVKVDVTPEINLESLVTGFIFNAYSLAKEIE